MADKNVLFLDDTILNNPVESEVVNLDCDFLDDEEVVVKKSIKLKKNKKKSYSKPNTKTDFGDCDFID